MINYKYKYLRYEEVWYDDQPNCRDADIVIFNQHSKRPVSGSYKEFFTMVIDLRQPTEEIMRRLDTSTAYQARRGRDKDKFQCEVVDLNSPGVISDFITFFDRYSAHDQAGTVYLDVLTRLAKAGFLEITWVKSPDNQLLAYHALVKKGKDRARLLHSVSIFRELVDSSSRNYVSRANRWLHLWEILRYKNEAIAGYDFGGWYMGTEDKERLSVNRFKSGFGGDIVKHYSYQRSVSVRGKLSEPIVAAIYLWRRINAWFRNRVRSNRASTVNDATDAA